MVKIYSNSKRLDENTLSLFEKNINIKLPHQYRAFLLEYNGGYPEPDGFKFAQDESFIDQFLSIGNGEHSNLESYIKTYKGRLPSDLLPIAHDPGGNLICIGIKNDVAGKVFYWDHEFESDEEAPDYSNVHIIAHDFNHFIDNLFEIVDED